MSNILGLSIDVNAIGWTLLDAKSNKVISMGSRVFPLACENYGSGKRELSKRAYKRGKRSTRLRYERGRKRRVKVLQLLVDNKMCPITTSELDTLKKEKIFPHEGLKDWLKLNPYKLRSRALQEPLDLMELGRLFYQVTLRRGFPVSERNRGKKDSVLYHGFPIQDRRGMNHTLSQIENSSLGNYLHSLLPKENESYTFTNERIRNRYLSREMFREELHSIWNYQESFHKELTPDLKKVLIGEDPNSINEKGAIFFQKPLKSQKHRVGRCPYEPQKTKCCISSLSFQEVQAYRWANSLKRDGIFLSPRDRATAVSYFLTHSRFEFSRVINLFEQIEGQYNINGNEIIKGSFVNAVLSKEQLFGPSWFGLSEKDREDIWHALYFFNDESKLRNYFIENWGFDDFQAKKIASIQLDKNFAPISKKAANNILYFLKHGLVFDLAVILAGVKNSFGNKWDTIGQRDVKYIIDTVLSLHKENKNDNFISELQEFLEVEMQLTSFQSNKLYGLEIDDKKIKLVSRYPTDKNADKEIRSVKNTHLINATFQLRKILNELIEEYGSINEIRGELSANIKFNKFQRHLNKLDQNRRNKLREKYISLLGEQAENITPMNLTKYELWEECKQTCPYTGGHISLSELFTDAVEVVYIQPWKYSLNDSHWNKTLCLKSFSSNIIEFSPYDYFSKHSPEEWSTVVKRAARLFSNTSTFPSSYRKFKRFIKKHNRRNPLKHQMKDNNLLSKELKNYLSKGVPKVSISPGQSTLLFIEKWRLNKLFDEAVYDNPQIDFRYIALLSYINANRTPEHIQLLATENKYNSQSKRIAFPEPYKGFRKDLEEQINSILVSHKKVNKLMTSRKLKTKIGDTIHENFCLAVRGSLHKETIMGKRTSPEDQQEAYHIRKNLNQIKTKKQLLKIVDPEIRIAVLEAIEEANGFNGESVPRGAFFYQDKDGFLCPKVFLPNKKGDPVPIKSVRIRESLSGVVQLKDGINQHVNLRNNHHVLIYLNRKEEYCEQVVSFWEAIKRLRLKEPVFQLPEDGQEFITTLQINDLFLLNIDKTKINLDLESKSLLANHLYRVQKLSSKFYEFRLLYDNDTSTSDLPNYIRINNFGRRKTGWLTYNPIKVWMNTIGKLSFKDEVIEFNKTQKSYV